jgi:ATP-dependent RNA helicase RhlE
MRTVCADALQIFERYNIMTTFSSFGLSQPIMKALTAKGYDSPTPIQVQAIPPVLDGRDLCGIAQTGTGKTAAFALPALDYLARNAGMVPKRSARVLVLSPTRELAAQIAQSFRDYGRFMNLSVAAVFGGVPIAKQIRGLAHGVDVMVATPGRLLDLIDQRAFHLKGVEIFVLDEADQMMDLGFIHPLRRIQALLPQARQSLFFSATMPKAIAELGDSFLDHPVKVSVAPAATTAERVQQVVTFVEQREKPALLAMALKAQPIDRALVFTRTKHGADRVVRQLSACGINAVAIHGNKSQAQRTTALQAFRDGRVRILIATDIAARGIDVSGVSHVFNYELPNVADQYVHRIGRTARAGAEGLAISFCAPDERNYLRDIERLTRVKCEVVPLPDNFVAQVRAMPKPAAEPVREERAQRNARPHGGRRDDGGHRGSQRREGEPRGDGERQRNYRPRKNNVGKHRGAVQRTAR